MKIFNYFLKTFTLIFIVLVMLLISKPNTYANTYIEKPQEHRAVWVSTFVGDIATYQNEAQYKSAFNTILDNMEEMGFNTMVFHVRTHNNALYKSSLNPLASWWSNVNFDEFDPLEYSIDAAHKRGIEFHAWMNPYRVSSNGVMPQYSSTSYPSVNPANKEENLIRVGNSIILDPGIPENRDFIVDTCMELVENYDVDAIHFDDYFYIKDANDATTRAKYNTYNLDIASFRRLQVDLFIEQLHNELKTYNDANNKCVELGISPSGVYRNGSYGAGMTPTYGANGELVSPLYSNTSGFAHYGDYLYSDTKHWIDREWIDYITPQTYHAISHPNASFKKLSEWWSWVVKYKKVNLSMGVGIYMAITNNGYWTTSTELNNQMLISNANSDISGLCLYKYGSLFDASANMQSHVNSLKQNWQTKVPSVPKPQHEHLLKPITTNVAITNNTLSWNKLDNVRGYMVYKVPTNASLNTLDINNLYMYTQDTSCEIEDGYDYYVTSVNKANYQSNPVKASKEVGVNRVISMINNIKFPVTQDMETSILGIKSEYDALSSFDKSKVTNYYLLENAINQINALKDIDNDITAFKNTLKVNSTSDYLLPLSYNGYSISWRYKDDASKAYYDIETGQVKVKYLDKTYINLVGTISKNGISKDFEYTLNVGYTKDFETPIFYRNTPHSMNLEEDKTSTQSYIGFSNKVLKYTLDNTNYVFFIPAGNIIEITDSSIALPKWHSCGHIYVNKTGSSITKTENELGVNETPNYGYFVVNANGLVKYSSSNFTSGNLVTIENNGFIVCLKYLDSQIINSPMKPATKFVNNTKVVIEDVVFEEIKDQDKALVIINEIAAIGEVSLSKEAQINRVKEMYDSSTTAVKSLVTNVDVLNNAVALLQTLKQGEQEIIDARNQAISTISNYLNLTNYSTTGINAINNLISLFVTEVNSKTNIQDINTLVASYKVKLDEVPTLQEEEALIIDSYKVDAIERINSSINKENYSTNTISRIDSIISNATTLINECTTLASIDTIVTNTINELTALPNKLAEYKENAIKDIDDTYNSEFLSKYQTSDQSQISSKIKAIKASINNAVSIEVVDRFVNNLTQYITSFKTIEEQKELNDAKEKALQDINKYILNKEYNEENKTKVDDIISSYETKINNASTIELVNELFDECISKIDLIKTQNPSEVYAYYKDDAYDYGKTLGITSDQRFIDLYEKFEKDFENITSKEDADTLLNKFKSDCDSYKEEQKTPSKTMSCMMSKYVVSLISLVGISYLVFFKKQ